MSEFLTVALQEAEKSTKNEVETVLLDTLYYPKIAQKE
jgi:hypothetical protein